MNPIQDHPLSQAEMDQFGFASATLLSQASLRLPDRIQDRLYAARMKALSMQKSEKVFAYQARLASTSSGTLSTPAFLKGNVGWVLPFLFLGLGLIAIAQWQQDSRINDIAEVDVALLTDEVPPDAYADNGFMIFLKNGPLADADQENIQSNKSDSAS